MGEKNGEKKEKGKKMKNRDKRKRGKVKRQGQVYLRGEIIEVCFPVYEYLPWDDKKTIKILYFTKAGKVF